MELAYIWIEKYKNIIKNQGFNFSSKLLFEFDDELFKLNIYKNNNYIEDFFKEKDNQYGIDNITALVGKNGSGKTVILDFFKEKLFTSVKKTFDGEHILDESCGNIFSNEKYIVIFINEQKIIMYYYQNRDVKELIIKNLSDFEIINKSYNLTNYSEKKLLKFDELPQFNMIYFSNIFDYKKEMKEEYHYKYNINGCDLSTGNLLKHLGGAEFRYNEIKMQVNFIKEFLDNDLNIDYPENFNIYLNNSIKELEEKIEENIEFYEKYGDKIAYNKSNILNIYKEYLFKIFDHFNPKDKNLFGEYDEPEIIFTGVLFLHFMNELIYLDYENLIKCTDFKYKEELDRMVKSAPEKLNIKYIKYILTKLKENMIGYFEKNIIDKLSSIIGIVDMMCKGEFEFTGHFIDEFEASIDLDKMMTFINYYQNSYFSKEVLYYDWRDMSSGQKAFLSIFSRLFSAKENLNDEIDNLIILIDELELYLHPQWQKEIIYRLTQYLPKMFSNKNIQVIITSNTPFLISDLPKENILYLTNKDQYISTRDSNSLKIIKKTFATNIHTLLSNSFFLQDGLIGTFARNKIDKVIEEITKYNTSNEYANIERYEKLKKIINIIGEPIIEHKLNLMLEECLQKEQKIKNIEDKIRDLQREKKKLEGEKIND